jgi:hypothetical protein
MTYTDADTPNSTWWWTDWNTVSYVVWKKPVSKEWKYPIVDITQQQAIDSCKSMWPWYHLITNNEWMSIARDIELQKENWSDWTVWGWHLYNGVSSDTTLWCDAKWWNTETRAYATKTWPWLNTDCNNKRSYILSNSLKIWDLSWNVREHVNKANTIDWSGYDTGTNPVILSTNGPWEWSAATNTNIALYWPQIWVDSTDGVWKIYQASWTVFRRGAGASHTSEAGIFDLSFSIFSTGQDRSVGFRCTK